MSRSSPIPFMGPNDPPPFINEGVAAPEAVYPPEALGRSRTSLNRSRTSLQQSRDEIEVEEDVGKKYKQDKKGKKEKKEDSGSGGGFGKLKGKLFKKKTPKESGVSEYADGVENADPGAAWEQPYESMPHSPNPYATSAYPAPVPFGTSAPPAPAPMMPMYPTRNLDRMEMKPAPPKSMCRSGNVLNVMLIGGFVIGVILCACIAADSNLVYIGPVILGLSLFAFCGKVFFTLFWEEDPVPWANPYLEKMESYVGPVKDPYGFNKPQTTTATNTAFVWPAAGGQTGAQGASSVEMGALAYSTRPPPAMYDESIDTRLRTAPDNAYATTPFTPHQQQYGGSSGQLDTSYQGGQGQWQGQGQGGQIQGQGQVQGGQGEYNPYESVAEPSYAYPAPSYNLPAPSDFGKGGFVSGD